jgi:outer membrane immunogenic protein
MTRFLASVAAVALLSSAAVAADLPLPMAPSEPAPVAVPGYDWSGIYVGVQGGWKFGEDDYFVTGFGDAGFDVDGPMVGGHLGGNFQTGMFVFGLEGDGEWADVSGTDTAPNGDEVSTDIEWQASIRGRVGLAWDRVLLYGTGGAAFAGTENRIFDASVPATDTEDDTRVGWTVGAGLDFGITQNLSAGVEYRYTDYGEEDYTTALFPGQTFTSDLSYHAVRGRVSWRFGGLGGY